MYHATGFSIPPTLVDAELRVERLVVPTRPFVPNGGAVREATLPWARVADRFGTAGSPSRVFLSRSVFHDSHAERTGTRHPRAFTNDHEVDDVMADHRFTVVHPETLGVDEQIRLAAGAEVIAGPSGTALHLAAFARHDTRVLELGDPRSPGGLPNQQAIAAVKGQPYAAVPLPASTRGSDASVDVRRLARSLRRLGLS